MLTIQRTKIFRKDVARARRRKKNLKKLETIIRLLIKEKPLPPNCLDHALIGNYKNRRECHIEPNWLLIYKKAKNTIIFERTGTHSDLFKS